MPQDERRTQTRSHRRFEVWPGLERAGERFGTNQKRTLYKDFNYTAEPFFAEVRVLVYW